MRNSPLILDSFLASNTFVAIVVFLSLFIIFLVSILIYKHLEKRNKDIFSKSSALKKLEEINKKYKFKDASMFEMYEYHFFGFGPDYFGGQQREEFIKKYSENEAEVKKGLENAKYNRALYKEYEEEIKEECYLGKIYDITDKKKLKKYKKLEQKFFKQTKLKPVLEFKVRVNVQTGKVWARHTFSEAETIDMVREAEEELDKKVIKK